MTIRKFQGREPTVHETAYVDEAAVVIGDVTVGADASIWPMTVARGDMAPISIGARTNIQDGSILHVNHDSEYAPGGGPLVIGDNVTAGHGVTLHACTVEDFCLIGMGALILDNAVIHSETIIGAGSLVSPGKTLESGYMWMGRPVKRIRRITDREREMLRYLADHYVTTKNQYCE